MTESVAPDRDPVPRHLAPIGYAAAIVILVDQLTRIAVDVPGFDPGYSIWRFQAATLLTGRIPILAIAVVLVIAAGEWSGQRRAVRVGLGLWSALVVVLAAVLAALWVDGTTARDGVPGPALTGFIHRWLRLLATGALGLVLMAGVAVVGWKQGSERRPSNLEAATGEEEPIPATAASGPTGPDDQVGAAPRADDP